MIGSTGASTGSALSSANAFSNRTRQASVCGPKPTQPLQPGVAPCLATTLVVKYTRLMSRWALVLLRHNRRFQVSALPFQGSPRTFFNSLITNLSSGGTRCNDRRLLDPIFRENDVFVCHWRLANPDSMAPSLIQIACWHGCVLVHHSFSEWQHLARVRFPKNTHKRSSPVFFSLEISSGTMLRVESTTLSRCCRLVVFLAGISSSDNHIARQTPLITRFAFSILP